jgi:hypothetical protein
MISFLRHSLWQFLSERSRLPLEVDIKFNLALPNHVWPGEQKK